MIELNFINGDIIELTLVDKMFDVVAHCCNCHNRQASGIAPKYVKAFYTDTYNLEQDRFKGDINKLGCISYKSGVIVNNKFYVNTKVKSINPLTVVNCYGQYYYGKKHSDIWLPLDYNALRMCFRKMNFVFKGKHIGLPKLGAKRAGGDWNVIEQMIKEEFKDCKVTIVIYEIL